MLKSIPRLEFHSDIHRYRYKYEWMLYSVTGVLGFDMPSAKRASIDFYKHGPDGWAARGEAIHKALESFLKNDDFETDEKWADWIGPLVNDQLFQESEVLAVEYSLCDPQKDLGGSFDFLLKKPDGNIVLGDLKTTSTKAAAKRREPATAQLGAYTKMLNLHHPTIFIDQCVTVVSGPDICKVIPNEVDECVEEWNEKWGLFEADQDLRDRW